MYTLLRKNLHDDAIAVYLVFGLVFNQDLKPILDIDGQIPLFFWSDVFLVFYLSLNEVEKTRF